MKHELKITFMDGTDTILPINKLQGIEVPTDGSYHFEYKEGKTNLFIYPRNLFGEMKNLKVFKTEDGKARFELTLVSDSIIDLPIEEAFVFCLRKTINMFSLNRLRVGTWCLNFSSHLLNDKKFKTIEVYAVP